MFKTRSIKQELLDGEVSKKDLILNLKELHIINRLLGGYSISIKALNKLNLQGKTIVDIGSGGGDMLHEIYKYAQKRNIDCSLIGIDLKQDCISYSKSHLPGELKFICDDYRNIKNHISRPDIIHACLFTHHLNEAQIIELLLFAVSNNVTLIINDLNRHPLAYFSIRALTKLFSKSHLVRNDAPLSVLRGFKKKEWTSFLEKAQVINYSIKWKWAFRHLVTVNG